MRLAYPAASASARGRYDRQALYLFRPKLAVYPEGGSMRDPVRCRSDAIVTQALRTCDDQQRNSARRRFPTVLRSEKGHLTGVL